MARLSGHRLDVVRPGSRGAGGDGADGRFEFTVSDNDPEVSRALRMTSGWPDGFGAIQVLASAEGFGPAWTDLAGIKNEIDLRLVPDDIPIEGRLLTLEGHPIAGVTVKTTKVDDAARSQYTFGAPSGFFQSATTGADGRFRLTGIGRGRRAVLGFAGGGIMHEAVQAVTGTFPADHPTEFRGIAQVGPKFEHLCKPGKAIEGVVRDLDTGAALRGNHGESRIRGLCLGHHRPERQVSDRRTGQIADAADDRLGTRGRSAVPDLRADGGRQLRLRHDVSRFQSDEGRRRHRAHDRPRHREAGAGLGGLRSNARQSALVESPGLYTGPGDRQRLPAYPLRSGNGRR